MNPCQAGAAEKELLILSDISKRYQSILQDRTLAYVDYDIIVPFSSRSLSGSR